MNSKILRLGFVMGGAVSLGTFSGAALTEAIKQLIVYGNYDSGQKNVQGMPVYKTYDRIEVDVFSGASAGAISLAIMLRVLTNHRDKYKMLGFSNYEEMRKMLENKLLGQFGEAAYNMKQQNPLKFESLIAAQAVQEFQEKIWSKEVDLNRLLGTGPHQKDLSNNSGVLDRNVVDNLGKKYIKFDSTVGRLDHRQLLADRVLFACTLSNLNYIVKKYKTQSEGQRESPFLKALNDTAIDRVHSEIRVFDLNFGEINPATVPYYPLRWVQYHLGEEIPVEERDKEGRVYNKHIKNLESNDSWREITATAIASGAFPFAFEPVVLNRYRHEFAQDWPVELKAKDSYKFTYFDGGAFNNEPIREGLRLASYLDHINTTVDFERMMIYIDPLVAEVETQFRVNAHDDIGLSRSLLSGKSKIASKSTFMRLAGKVPHLLSAILNEARGSELSKISTVLEQFDSRNKIRNFYKSTVSAPSDNESVIEMRSFVISELDKIRKKLELPPNTLQIQHELLRILGEEHEYFKDKLPLDDKAALIDGMQQFVYTPLPKELPSLKYWMLALSCVALDIAMKLTAKAQKAKIVPIAPFDFYNNAEQYELMRLPGSGILGFAGFASEAAGNYEVRYGQYCAYRVLRDLGVTSGQQYEMSLPAPFDYSNFSQGIKDNVCKTIMKRIREMIPSEYTTVLPFMEGYVENAILKFIDEKIDDRALKKSVEFRIQVPNDLVSLRGFNNEGSTSKKNSVEPVKLNSGIFLVAQLTYFPVERIWKGDFVNSEQKLFIDKMRFFENTPSVAIVLPQLPEGHEAFVAPNPMFYIDARGHLNISGYTEMKQLGWKMSNNVEALDDAIWAEDDIAKFSKLT